MKKTILIISILSLLIMGCSEDDAPTAPTTDYTEWIDELEQEIPPCYLDCGITSPTSMCTLLLDDTASTCMDDCGEGDQPDEEFIDMCTTCIAADNCDEVMMDDDGGDDDGDDDDDDGDDGDDGDDDGDFPECFEDCDISMFLSPTATCEFFAGDDISCTADCTGDDALMLILFPLMCGTCVADGNCDELFEDDSDDDDDGYDECDMCHDNCDDDQCHDDCDDDDCGPPECFDDCDFEPTDDSTGTEICEFIGGDISCTEDCIGDDAIPEEFIGICAACLVAGNCDEIFDDDGDDDDDDDDDDDGE